MIRLTWQNTKNGRQGEIVAESEDALNLDYYISKNLWGLPDRWLTYTDGSHTEERIVTPEIGKEYTEYFFPVDYTYEIVDITTEWNEQNEVNKAVERGKRKARKCQECLDYLRGQVDETLELNAIKKLFPDIKQALLDGDLKEAKTLAKNLTGAKYGQLKKDLRSILERD